MRPGGAAAAPAPVAGPAAARGRAGRSGGLARFLPDVAGRRRRSGRDAVRRSWLGRPRAPGRGRRPARRPAVPGIRPRARRPAGPRPGLPAAPARRAGCAGRGRLGGARQPRPRRRPDRAVPARPRGAPAGRRRPDERRAARRTRATTRSASTWPAAAPPSTASCSRPPAAARTATSSTRCGISCGRARSPTTRSRRCARCAGSGPARDRGQRPGRLTALGPPEAAGRWSLVAPADRDGAPPDRAAPRPGLALLERHGVLTREAVAGEGIEGGFSAVYPVLRALEEAGRIRRGYFVDGLGAAQFALPGAARPAARRARAVGRGRAPGRASTCSPPPTRPTRTAPRCPGRAAATTTDGRSSGRPAPTSCWSTATPPSTWSVAARRSRRCHPPTTRRSPARRWRPRRLVADGRFRELVVDARSTGSPWPSLRCGPRSSRRASCPATAASRSARPRRRRR